MKKIYSQFLAVGVIGLLCLSNICSAQKNIYQLQKDFVDMRFGMFIHFNLGTFTSVEWTAPNQNPTTFAPTNVDCAQWAATAKAAGMKFAILTTKHHDGFALWPTKFGKKNRFGTYQNVAYSGWKKDIVRQFVDEFRKAGIIPCIYYSIWDRTEGIELGSVSQGDMDVIKGQLTELLGGNYGQFPLIIFDGWTWRTGHNEVSYQFVRELVKSLQPNILISDHNGLLQPFEEDIMNFELFTTPSDNIYASTRGVSMTPPGWFWHPETPTTDPMSLNQIISGPGLATTEPHYSNLVLNCPPNRNGQIDANVVKRLQEVGAKWKPNLNRPPLPTQPVQCDHPVNPVAAFASSNNATAGNAIDALINYDVSSKGAAIKQFLWESAGSFPQSVTIDLGANYSNIDMVTYMPRQDHPGYWTSNITSNYTTTGNITDYNIYTSTDNKTYKKVAGGTWSSDAKIKRVLFPATNARYVRLEALSANASSIAIVEEFGAGGLANMPVAGGSTITGMDEEFNWATELNVFPNPFKEATSIKCQGVFSYSVYNQTGVEIESGSGENEKSICSGLIPGVYFLKIQNTHGAKQTMIIKN